MIESRAELFLETLVNSASSTTRQSDVRRTHRILAEALESLAFQVNWIRDPSGKTDDLMIAERPAFKHASASGSRDAFITMVSHIDTVLSPAEAGTYRRESTPEGVRARGAGIIDNKGGLAVLVESMRLFLSANPNPSVGFRVVSSPDEENGSSAWHETFRELGTKSAAVLGFEPALDDGSIISSRRGNRWYNIGVRGAEAHAGRCSGEEINAAHEAARLTVRLIELRDRLRTKFESEPGRGISLHVGHIEGGRDRHNVVCGEIRMKIDTRFSSFEEREALHAEVVQILESPEEINRDGLRAKIEFEIVDDCPPFASDPKTIAVVELLSRQISGLESVAVKPPAKAGGAGDVNHMSRPGLLILDGLGPVGGRMHTVDEFLRLSTLETRAQALANWYPSLIEYVLQDIDS